MSHSFHMFILVLLSTLINVPLGYWRKGYEKFTLGWFFYAHISISVTFYLISKTDSDEKAVIFTISGAIIGHFFGSFVAKKN